MWREIKSLNFSGMYGLFRVYGPVASLVTQLVCFSLLGDKEENSLLRDWR